MSAAGTADFLIVGGGIIGLAIGLELKRRRQDAAVTLIEKEDGCGVHASGRNSGVLHAGFYYTRSEERRVGKECRSRWSPYH